MDSIVRFLSKDLSLASGVHTMKFSAAFFLAMSFLVMSGCTPRTSIGTLRISDPDAGGPIDAPVQPDGTFSKETKTGGFVSVVSGTVSNQADGVASVKLTYDRKMSTATGGTRTEKIETTFTAQADVEVPIGRNPSQPDASGNATANVTATLLRGK